VDLDPIAKLRAIVEAQFPTHVSERRKLAVWFGLPLAQPTWKALSEVLW